MAKRTRKTVEITTQAEIHAELAIYKRKLEILKEEGLEVGKDGVVRPIVPPVPISVKAGVYTGIAIAGTKKAAVGFWKGLKQAAADYQEGYRMVNGKPVPAEKPAEVPDGDPNQVLDWSNVPEEVRVKLRNRFSTL